MQVKRSAGKGPINMADPALDSDLRAWLPRLSALWKEGQGGGAGALTAGDMAGLGRSLLMLQRGLTGGRELAGAGYMENPELLGAYLLYYWPVSYLEGRLALSSVEERLNALSAAAAARSRPLRVLDCGSGPAPLSAALVDSLAGTNCNYEITLLDSSPAALELGRRLLGLQLPGSSPVRIRSADLESADGLMAEDPDAAAQPGPFDLILLGHTLNELWRGAEDRLEKRGRFARGLVKQLCPQGLLLILEPALLETSRSLLAVRDLLVDAGCRIAAPCLAPLGLCPALAAGPSHTCHFELGWRPPEPVASLARAAGLDRESVKVCFIAVEAGLTGLTSDMSSVPTVSKSGDRPMAGSGADSSGGGDRATAGDRARIFARVVSEPMLNKAGRIRYLLCDGKRRFAFSARNGDPDARAKGFFDLCRGDCIEIGNPEVRGAPQKGLEGKAETAFGCGASTSICILEKPGTGKFARTDGNNVRV